MLSIWKGEAPTHYLYKYKYKDGLLPPEKEVPQSAGVGQKCNNPSMLQLHYIPSKSIAFCFFVCYHAN